MIKQFLLLFIVQNIVFADPICHNIGPMIHYNFGRKLPFTQCLSYGLEYAYYDFDKMPYSYNVGIEFERKKCSLYSEVQFGSTLGVSAGPFIEAFTDSSLNSRMKIRTGIQGTVWASFVGGIYYRVRIPNYRYFTHGLGIFGKMLFPKGSWI